MVISMNLIAPSTVVTAVADVAVPTNVNFEDQHPEDDVSSAPSIPSKYHQFHPTSIDNFIFNTEEFTSQFINIIFL